MKFSIVVPVYNAEPFLDSCIQSVESQLSSDWELILIDDGSSDKSGKMLDDYAMKDSRICYKIPGPMSILSRRKG